MKGCMNVCSRARMCGGSKIDAVAARHSSRRTQLRSAGAVVVFSATRDTRACEERLLRPETARDRRTEGQKTLGMLVEELRVGWGELLAGYRLTAAMPVSS